MFYNYVRILTVTYLSQGLFTKSMIFWYIYIEFYKINYSHIGNFV
jgi:hypothetical protein